MMTYEIRVFDLSINGITKGKYMRRQPTPP